MSKSDLYKDLVPLLAAFLLMLLIVFAGVKSLEGHELSSSGKEKILARWEGVPGEQSWKPYNLNRLIGEAHRNRYDNILVELDRDPGDNWTRKERERAWELYKNSFKAAKKNDWFDYEEAADDGYQSFFDPTHYPKDEYLKDNETLNYRKPEFLMYKELPEEGGKKVLVGIMFQAPDFATHPRQVAGSITTWHRHIYMFPACFRDMRPLNISYGERVERFFGRTGCPPESRETYTSPEMMHVWFVDHPKSQFAHSMRLPPETVRDLDSNISMMSKKDFMEKHQNGPEFN